MSMDGISQKNIDYIKRKLILSIFHVIRIYADSIKNINNKRKDHHVRCKSKK